MDQSLRRFGFVAVTLAFVAFWIIVFSPAITLWLASQQP
jgi:hypothetical protein